ncbi:MAG TPA: BTAD domain-containing putative transcriptional regulator [Gaiellaceae bacterium]|nr:BTAD domain-containing putative transcriptional regulator [Gaiellaceae bacterium]
MRSQLETRILGPLEVLVGGERVDIKGGKQRELLAILLIHANEIVSPDRLIEELWGETPPPSALKTLQALVSRLRANLGSASGALETHGHGYRFHVEQGRLDADAFRTRLEGGRRALARGAAEEAADELRKALALWRGPALAEFRYGSFAQAEIARLEELRLAAQEERIEADLELARHEKLVVELETLVAEHPLRERLRRQLMLALYRSGRQAEALQAYQEGRRALAEELGLEPSEGLQRLERQILDHDPEIAAPEPAARPRLVPTAAWRHPRRIAAAGALVLALAIGGAVYQGARGSESVDAAGALALDPDTGGIVASVPLGTAPSAVAVGEGSVWVVDADDRTVSQIDAETRTLVRTFSTSATPTDVGVGAGSLWIGNAPSGSFLPTSILRFDPETSLVVDTIDLGAPPGGHLGAVLADFSRQHIAAAEDAVWVINPDLTVSRIDPRSNAIVARIDDVGAENIAVGEGEVWITEGTDLAEIDPSVNEIARRIPVGEGVALAGIAIGGGAVWVADPQAGKLWRVETGPKPAKRSIPLETWVAGVSFGEGAVWVTNEIADAVYRIDPRTGDSRRVGGATAPRAVDAGEGGVWLTAASPPSEDAALPASVCRDVYYSPGGKPDVLVVSSLPLQGDGRQWAQPMVDAIRRVLEQRGFEAGAFSVGYQSCDSSSAQLGREDFFRCGFIAKAFARNLRVVGVFGSFTSPCSYPQIPIANQAPGGPLAMISPANTLDDLTEDDDLYPTGTRNYFRLATPEGYQGPAHVEVARALGQRRLFLLTSRAGEYAPRYVDGLRAYARRVGVRIVGEASFDPEAGEFEQLVRRVVRSKPQSVAIVGLLSQRTGAMIRELRAALGPEVALSAPDDFYLPEVLRKLAGDAAEGMYVTYYGVPNDKLPPRGRQFLESFASERGGDPGPDFAASYGAQGAEIFLDAIARSDGTRASVTEEVRRTQVRNGIIGDVAFDAKGDLLEGPLTILRFSGRDFVVDRVVTVRTPATRP